MDKKKQVNVLDTSEHNAEIQTQALTDTGEENKNT